jgi:hypothetical protein
MEVSEHSRRLYGGNTNGTESGEKPHTLEEYALDHFRLLFYIVYSCYFIFLGTIYCRYSC